MTHTEEEPTAEFELLRSEYVYRAMGSTTKQLRTSRNDGSLTD